MRSSSAPRPGSPSARHRFSTTCANSTSIQLVASRTTEWTRSGTDRYLESMNIKRSKYDPLANSRLTRWLVLRDMFHNVLDATELPPGTDLRTAFADGLAQLERAGWQSEGASGGLGLYT